MNPLIKDLLREIRNTKGRFLSIFFIVLIGVAFFAGIWASPADMLYSADDYYDEYNLMDLKIVSNFGLNEDDVLAISEVEGIEEIYPSFTYDFVANEERVFRVGSFDSESLKTGSYINQYKLISGRLPEAKFECVVENAFLDSGGYELGDYIVLKDPENKLIFHRFKIVGFINTPFYLSYSKGSSDLGSGSVDRYMYIDEANFHMEIYTEVYVTVNDARGHNSYKEDYFDLIKPVKNDMLAIASVRSEKRLDEIKAEANNKLDEYRQEYEDGLKEYEEKIAEAEQEISDAEDEILLGKANISTSRIVLASNIASTKEQIRLIEEQIKALELQAETARTQYELQKSAAEEQKENLQEVNEGLKQELDELEPAYNDIQSQIDSLNQRNQEIAEEIMVKEAELAELEAGSPEYIQLQTEITALNTEMTANSSELISLQLSNDYMMYNSKKQQYDLNLQQIELIDNGIIQAGESFKLIDSQLEDAYGQLDQQNNQLDEMEREQTALIDRNERELLAGEQELAESKVLLEEEREKGLSELEDGAEKIKKAEKDIGLIDNIKWYVLDRNSHYSYVDYRMTAEKMEAIAMVFPVFFLLVAALVTLTTMTRLVDEKRLEIGTFKALGYSEGTIRMKYLIYGLSATLLGSVFGLVVGMYVFPMVIYNSWNLMYSLPPIKYVSQVPLMITSVSIMILVTGSTILYSCNVQLSEVPGMLLRPKPPKNGKTIVLEKVTFIWKRLSFTSKVTARNIFRYKKKMFMTIIGITGCTALLVAGFGISDSISDLVELQFKSIYKYDAIANLDNSLSSSEINQVMNRVKGSESVTAAALVDIENASVLINNEESDIQLIIPSSDTELSEYIDLRNRHSAIRYDLDSEGVLVTEKFSRENNIDVDDDITIVNEDGYSEEFRVVAIIENYIGSTIYMSNIDYQNKYELKPVYNNILLKTNSDDNEVSQEMGEIEMIHGVTFYTSLISSFNDTVASLDIVVIVLVISAACLAFVVLYNLTNVNISERTREIATLKVLGFRVNEVNSYVYRENILLTIIGAISGLLGGTLLHQLIMTVVETDDLMYGRQINLTSYLISFALTILFSMIVNFIMSYRLKRIKMVESLKSVE